MREVAAGRSTDKVFLQRLICAFGLGSVQRQWICAWNSRLSRAKLAIATGSRGLVDPFHAGSVPPSTSIHAPLDGCQFLHQPFTTQKQASAESSSTTSLPKPTSQFSKIVLCTHKRFHSCVRSMLYAFSGQGPGKWPYTIDHRTSNPHQASDF